MSTHCPYGQCTMLNLCRDHCVRQAMEADGWVRGPDGQLVPPPDPKPPLFLPHYLVVAYSIAIPEGWVFHPHRDGWTPPAPTADATVPANDTAVTIEQAAMQDTTPEA